MLIAIDNSRKDLPSIVLQALRPQDRNAKPKPVYFTTVPKPWRILILGGNEEDLAKIRKVGFPDITVISD